MGKVENAYKLVLSTGKSVMLREVKIKHQSLASRAAAMRAGESPMAVAMEMQQELLKLLIVSVDGKTITGPQREDLDEIFTFAEYSQVSKFVQKLIGGDEKKDCQMEIVTIGAQ